MVITTDTVEALKYMKQGRVAYKKSERQILYNAVFDEATKKYTIYKSGEEMTVNADWESFFCCDEWEVKQ